MSRWKASAIHLALSALVVGTLAALLVWRWYPPALVEVTGADTLLLLVGCVDLVMGPLLTLVVYQQGKKTLRFDLSVIAALQLAALLYGLHAAWQTRPVFLVASDTQLTLVTANEFSPAVMRDAPDAYRRLPVLGPRTVGMKTPDAENASLLAVAGPRLPSQFRPYEEVAGTLGRNALMLDELATTLDAQARSRLDRAARQTGRDRASLGAVPVRSIRGEATILLDRTSGEVLVPVRVRMPQPESTNKPPRR